MCDDLKNNGCTNHKVQSMWNFGVNCILTTSTNTGNCDTVQGFALNHRVGGGTESRLDALIIDTLTIDFLKKSKLLFNPSSTISNCVVEPYYALSATH